MEYILQIIGAVAIMLLVGSIVWNILAHIIVSPDVRKMNKNKRK